MVSPVSSGIQQQIPAANTFQPGGNQDAQKAQKDDQETQASSGSTAAPQTTETRKADSQTSLASSNDHDQDDGLAAGSKDRGSVLDLTV